MDASELLTDVRLVPVVTVERAENAVPLARALFAAGISAVEVTLRTPAALRAIEMIAEAIPEMILGAGSVRRAEHLTAARSAGAQFGVCPGSSAELLETANRLAFPFVPGAETATEMIALLAQGYCLQKFFPAELLGGIARLKAVSAPLPEIRFFPAGGITAATAPEYLAFESVHCIGGSWFIPADALVDEDFATIEQLARETMQVTIP